MSDIDSGQLAVMLDGVIERHLPPGALADQHDSDAAARIWSALHETGLTLLGLGDSPDGFRLDIPEESLVFDRLGAADPGLACALALHVTACDLLAATGPASRLEGVAAGARLGFAPRIERGGLRLEDPEGSPRIDGSIALLAVPDARGWWVPLQEPAERWAFVDVETEGLSVLPADLPMGLRSAGWVKAQLAGCPAILAETGPAERALDAFERRLASILAGMLESAVRDAGRYANQRYQGGRMISGHDTVREILGRALLEAEAARAFALRTDAVRGAAYYAASAAARSAAELIQVYGGYGYMEDMPIERVLRDAQTIQSLLVPIGRGERGIAARRLAAWEE